MNGTRIFIAAVILSATLLLCATSTSSRRLKLDDSLVKTIYSSLAKSTFCTINLKKCRRAEEHAKEAGKAKRRRFPNSPPNGNGDAFGHCYWSARLSRDMGEAEAKGFADRLVEMTRSPDEKIMHKHNNAIGRLVSQSTKSYEAAIKDCARLIGRGTLMVYDGKTVGPSALRERRPMRDQSRVIEDARANRIHT